MAGEFKQAGKSSKSEKGLLLSACQYCGKTAQYVSLTYLYTDRFVFKQTGSALSFIYSLIPTRWRHMASTIYSVCCNLINAISVYII